MITAEDVAEFVEYWRYVTMAEISDWAGDEGKGDATMWWTNANNSLKNCVLWANVSRELAAVLQQVQQEKLIHPHEGQELTYLLDGKRLDLPIAKKPPKNGYKEPHWLPVVFQPGQRCPDDPACPWYK
jgi:hypothetical protein